MKMVSIPEQEYLQLKKLVAELQAQLTRLGRKSSPTQKPLALKRGSGKEVILNMSDDFTFPLKDFEDYTSGN